MRSLDTNVLVRYLTADDAHQLAAAERIVDECREAGEPLFLATLVLCEAVWVLDRSYDLTKPQIIEVLDRILTADQFRFEREAPIRRALERFRKGNFADYLIGEAAAEAGCRDTVTFDRALKGSEGFTVLA
ncbi:MAG: PIN domain-containing protein [Bryobacteraceae bacterium]